MVRVKHRYLLLEIIPESGKRLNISFNEAMFYKIIKDLILDTHGDFGLASVQKYLNVKYVNPHTNIAIVRTKRGTQRLVSSALLFLKSFNGIRVILKTLHVSATIRSCQKFLASYHQRQMPLLLHDCKTVEEKAAVQQAITNYNTVSFVKSKPVDTAHDSLDIFDSD